MSAMQERRIAEETKCVCRLTARREFDDGTSKGNATSTGFFWRHNTEVYVVTNWHCLSGDNPNTLKPIGSFSPNKLLIEGKIVQQDTTDMKRSLVKGFRVETAIEDTEGRRLWTEHPRRHLVDVAALRLPIGDDGGSGFCCLNEISYEDQWSPDVGADAFIVGFPEGVSAAHSTPIWKRASIASEPDLGYEDTPVFLVDTVGNRGLSGSPVVASGSGVFIPNGKLGDDTVLGTWKKFVGVYAGRLGEAGIQSQLGRVWKAEVIDELFLR